MNALKKKKYDKKYELIVKKKRVKKTSGLIGTGFGIVGAPGPLSRRKNVGYRFQLEIATILQLLDQRLPQLFTLLCHS